ncbi:unnamed protein product [Sphenostylis stenocarpa]|uniref:SHSP domain-containing protein n=1 Tax=Sphenostylis stenocarpa TaxID=92480 RepID=A0AA86SDN4_9FABA|nr:unnamed protein product [Sphenostylis stenocarpa]
MDLELGLKITKTRDDIASISEYRLAKAGPIFQSRETNTAFILTAHLKGYKRNNINIKISEDGSKISISGEKPVQNILMMGWLMHRKEVDVAGFNKVFKIPDGVKLDGIKAKYDEEEWIMNIIMPKLVKGICGAKVEEVNEEESDIRRRSEQGKSEGDHILGGAGETSQKGSKESDVQAVEDSECFMEKKEEVSNKMLDDSNRKIIKDTVHKEVEESKVGTVEGHEECFGEEEYEEMKTSELERDVGVGTSLKIGEASRKEIEESKLKNEDLRLKGTRKDVGKAAYEAVKTLEKGKSAGEGMPQNMGDTRQDIEFEVQEMEDNEGFVDKEDKGVSENMLDGEVIQKEKEESKSGIKDRHGESVTAKNGIAGYKGMKTSEIEQNVGAHVTQNIGDTIQGVSKESVIEQMWEDKSTVKKMEREEPGKMLPEANVSTEGDRLGESNQKQFGELKSKTEDRFKESVKESRMELMETMKTPKHDQKADDQIPINIGDISQEEFKDSGIQRKEKTESIKESMDGGKSGKIPVRDKKHIFGKSIQEKNIRRPKIETGVEDKEYDGLKAAKEEFDSKLTIREEFHQQLPKGTIEESRGLSISKMKETEEAKIKRKLKESEYFVDKGEGEELRRMHKEAKKDLTKKTLKENEDIEEVMDKREGKENKYFVDKSEGIQHKRMHMEAKKESTKETMQRNEEAMDKREGREIDHFLDEGESEEPKRIHMESWEGLTTKRIQETEDVKEVMSKRKDKDIEKYADKGEGEEPSRLYVEAKDIKKETMQESEDVQEATLKREGKKNEHFRDKGGEKPKSLHMEAKKNLAKETLQETGVKEAIIKRKGKEIGNFDKGEGAEPTKMLMNAIKELTKQTKQQNEIEKEAMVKRKGKETKYFVDKGEDEEPKSMHMKGKKDVTTKTIQESEDFRETMVKREGKGYDYFVDKGGGEEPKSMHMKPKKDVVTKETMQENEGVREAMVKRKGNEIGNFADKDEGEEHIKMLVKLKEELPKETKKEREKVKEAIVKRKGKETEYFAHKGEDGEPKSMLQEVKDLTSKTIQESEAMVKREDKGDGEELKMMHMEAKKNMGKESMQETEGLKEEMAKRKGEEIGHFSESEGKVPKRVYVEAKKVLTTETMQENEYVNESNENECSLDEGEGEEPKRMYMKTKKDFTNETLQESENVKVKVKREGKEIECFADKSKDKESIRMLIETKRVLEKKGMHENDDVNEAMIKRKGKEIEYVVDSSEGEAEEHKRMHIEESKDLATETMHEIEEAKVMIKTTDKEIENFADEGKKESKIRETKKDSTKVKLNESEDAKEAMINIKGTEAEYFTDEGKEPKRIRMKAKDLTMKTIKESEAVREAMVKGEGEEAIDLLEEGEDVESGRMHIETKKDITKETMQESEEFKKVMVKRKGKEAGSFVDLTKKDEGGGEEPNMILMGANRDLTTKTMHESEYIKEEIFRREGKEIDYFVGKGESEELERTHEEAKKDITEDEMQEVEKIKHGIRGSEQYNVLGKTVEGKVEVTEEGPKLVGGQDVSRGLKVAYMEEPKQSIKEEMAETKSLMEKVQGGKSKKNEEASKINQKNTSTEILQKETEESNIERKFIDGPNVPNNMVKVVFEVLGTFQAKLPKQVMEAIAQNKKDKNEYVTVKLKGEGSIKMHVEPNEAFDEDETEDRSEKEIRKLKLKSSEQISGKENFDFGVTPKFLEMGQIQAVKEDNAQIEESEKKIYGDKYEKIQVEEKGKQSTQKGREGPKIQTMVKEQHYLQEEKAAKEEFPTKMVDSLAVKREGLEETKIEEAPDVKEELVKQRSKDKKTDVKEKGKEIDQQYVKNAKGEKYEKIQVEAKGGLRGKLTKENDQQCLQEGMSKRISMTCKDVPEHKHPKVLEIRSPEREPQLTKGKEMLTTQEETERPKDKIVDRDQQYVLRDVAEGVGKVDTKQKEMPQKEYVADPCSIAPRMEKKRDLKAISEREKYIIAQNVKDEKPKIQDENIKVDVEKADKKGYQTKAVEGMLKGEHTAKVVPKKERERPKFAKIEEDKEASSSKLPIKREMGKTTKAAEDTKPKMGEITPQFEKASGFKQAAEKTHENSKREHQKESSEVTPKIEVKPATMTPKKEVEKSKKEDMSSIPTAIQRKEPRELSFPTKDYQILKIEEVQQRREGKRPMHALEATTSKGGELAQAIATHSKAKSEIDEQQVNQLSSPSIEMRSIEPPELEKHGMKEDDSKAERLDHMQEGQEPFHFIDSKAASEVIADEAAEPSKFPSSSFTEPFKVEEKGKLDVSCDDESQDSDIDSEIDGEASIKGETDEKVVQPESPEDQQCTNKAQEESDGTQEVEEEKADEQVDEADGGDFQQLEEQKEREEEAIGGKKDQKRSKKLIVSTIIAGSALLASGIFLFIRHRRSRKG